MRQKPMSWQWANRRSPDLKVLVEIRSLEAPSTGLFGIGESPSIAENLPDPTLSLAETSPI